mmetsp:Transcript_5396/g.12611  ORF Transcript_5396/g.12611 Transcript_5396/m.12611 type:complete len:228 (-) Transcript_5396:739-1422(-)
MGNVHPKHGHLFLQRFDRKLQRRSRAPISADRVDIPEHLGAGCLACDAIDRDHGSLLVLCFQRPHGDGALQRPGLCHPFRQLPRRAPGGTICHEPGRILFRVCDGTHAGALDGQPHGVIGVVPCAIDRSARVFGRFLAGDPSGNRVCVCAGGRTRRNRFGSSRSSNSNNNNNRSIRNQRMRNQLVTPSLSAKHRRYSSTTASGNDHSEPQWSHATFGTGFLPSRDGI